MMCTTKVILLLSAYALSACHSGTSQKSGSKMATSDSTSKEQSDDNVMVSKTTERNRKIVDDAFSNWIAGKGSIFDLLADDVVWQVMGKAPFSGVYRGKQEFMDKAVTPINDFLSTSIKPELIDITASEDIVWLQWRGTATANDGGQYVNEYAWKLRFDDGGKVVGVDAFLDTYTLSKLVRK